MIHNKELDDKAGAAAATDIRLDELDGVYVAADPNQTYLNVLLRIDELLKRKEILGGN